MKVQWPVYPQRLNRHAHEWDMVTGCELQAQIGKPRKDVDMLVAVQVCHLDPMIQDALNLRAPFRSNICQTDIHFQESHE